MIWASDLEVGLPALVGCLAVGALIATASASLIIPATRPFLVELCRAEHRGRFWTRFLGVSLVLAMLLGVVLGFISGPRFQIIRILKDGEGAIGACAAMIRLALQFGALVLILALFGTLVIPPGAKIDSRDERSSEGSR